MHNIESIQDIHPDRKQRNIKTVQRHSCEISKLGTKKKNI